MNKPKPSLKLKKPALKRPFKRTDNREKKVDAALSNVPRITNDTVAEHREDVLKSARKYIYPLQHSKHRVVRISIALFVAVVIGFFAFCGISLYKLQSTSRFMYAVTQVVPFPVAKAGHRWVSYESYLFELRRNMHYYQTQQQANFKTKDGINQLNRLKKQALQQVTADAYTKVLAEQNKVSVTNADVANQLAIVRSQNRLGSNDRVFKEVLNEFWGWDESDFKRELRQQLLTQAVASKLNTEAHAKAEIAVAELKGGADFIATVAKYSDDQATKATGGNYAQTITPNAKDIAPMLTDALTKLKPGQTSDVVDAGYTLEILKVIDRAANGSMHAAHIQITLKPVSTYIKPLEQKQPPHTYIKV
jgi:parvulin-like peptidyl-prolyl isomerase